MNEKDNLVPISICHFQDALFQFWHDKNYDDRHFPLWMADQDILPSDKYQYVQK